MRKILYAEDNSGMRKMVSHYLGAVGFEVVVTTDGDEAIEIANKEIFDAILLDVTMERIDGISATKAIRQLDNANSNAPIVGLTGRTEQSEIAACLEAGMDRVLGKPVDLDLLAEVMAYVCRGDSEKAKESTVSTTPEESFEQTIYLAPKIIDIGVLSNYQKAAGAGSVEGILRDFSDSWPRKIGQLYSCLVGKKSVGFARALEELGAIAAGIGAGKVAELAGKASVAENEADCLASLSLLVQSCDEVQSIINALSSPEPSQIERVHANSNFSKEMCEAKESTASAYHGDFDFSKFPQFARQ
jgi:CheY-like chemotaxis protein